jgi:hypothetical protein
VGLVPDEPFDPLEEPPEDWFPGPSPSHGALPAPVRGCAGVVEGAVVLGAGEAEGSGLAAYTAATPPTPRSPATMARLTSPRRTPFAPGPPLGVGLDSGVGGLDRPGAHTGAVG